MEVETDLFGEVPAGNTAVLPGRSRGPKGGKRYTAPRGYAALPGSGPAGETCGTCMHIGRYRRYRKCKLMRAVWTNGPGTDILARTPACSRWQPDSAGDDRVQG